MQLLKAYNSEELKPNTGQESDSLFRFYGKPEIIVIIDEYVKLPTMEEVLINLVPKVLILFKRGEPTLRIESLSGSIALFPPLVLVDNIPIFDLKSVLSIDPIKVERIEVVNEIYLKGGMGYGGIINITSVKKDMAAVDLPAGSYFFDYQTFSPGDSKILISALQDSGLNSGLKSGSNSGSKFGPDSRLNSSNEPDRIPDSRNTIVWMDRINPGEDGRINLHFSAPSNPGEYQILVRGRTNQGEIVQGVGSILVKQE